MPEGVAPILAPFGRERKNLIPILQKVQEEIGYLSEESLSDIAHFLHVSKNEVYGVASFYAQFRFKRPGKHVIKVCLGTACHVRGGPRIIEAVERKIGISSGETTPDYRFSLERVACFGSCALAPVMVVGKTVYGKMDTTKARKILGEYSGQKGE